MTCFSGRGTATTSPYFEHRLHVGAVSRTGEDCTFKWYIGVVPRVVPHRRARLARDERLRRGRGQGSRLALTEGLATISTCSASGDSLHALDPESMSASPWHAVPITAVATDRIEASRPRYRPALRVPLLGRGPAIGQRCCGARRPLATRQAVGGSTPVFRAKRLNNLLRLRLGRAARHWRPDPEPARPSS